MKELFMAGSASYDMSECYRNRCEVGEKKLSDSYPIHKTQPFSKNYPISGKPALYQTTNEKKKGFALILSLSLMSLVILLTVTISSLLTIEIRNVKQSGLIQNARQNAILAASIALGELQKHAGPDQRVTARAEILENMPEDGAQRHWTGVWDTTSTSTNPSWLVSGLSENQPIINFRQPDSELDALLVGPERIGENASDDFVYAPRVEIGPSVARGNFAYWIADEGVKASLVPLLDSTRISNTTSMNDADYLVYSRQRSAMTAAQPSFVTNEAHAASETYVARLRDLEEMPYAWANGSGESSVYSKNLAGNFHDYTGLSIGLLTNTLEGGFKKDLSSITRLNPTLSSPQDNWINESVLRALGIWEDMELEVLEPEVIRAGDSWDDPSLKLAPFITEFLLGMAISGNAATIANEEVLMYYYIFAELWNPFSKALNFSPRHIYDDIIVRITGLPEVELTNVSSGATSTFQLPPLIVDLDFYDFIDGSQRDRFEAGRVTWTGNPAGSGSGSVVVEGQTHLRRNGVYIVEEPVGYISGTTVDDFEATFSETDLLIEFFLKRESFDDDDDPHILIQQVEIQNYPEFAMSYTGGDGVPNSYEGHPTQFFRPRNTNPHGVNRASINQNRNGFSYYYRVYEDMFTPSSTDFDEAILQNILQRDRIIIDLNGPFDGMNRVFEVDPDPPLVSRNLVFSDLDFFSAKDSSFDSNPERWAYFQDLPKHPPVELTQLNFLIFSEDGYEKLGKPNDGELNRIYDQYFLSGWVNNDDIDPDIGSLLPNPRYIVETNDSLNDYDQSAFDIRVRGAFNVNSTSIDAWEGILMGSNIEQWEYPSHSGIRQENLLSAFFNFQDFGSDAFKSVSSTDVEYRDPLRENLSGNRSIDRLILSNVNPTTPVPPAFRQGFREITMHQRREIAESIVNLIKGRERPFYSLQEFLDEGILQDAIDESGINTDTEDGSRIPMFSPGYLSQTTIASMIGSRLSPRSDTFRIISYGQSFDGISETGKEVRLELLVFRNASQLANNGRSFTVKGTKWLD